MTHRIYTDEPLKTVQGKGKILAQPVQPVRRLRAEFVKVAFFARRVQLNGQIPRHPPQGL